MYVQIYELKFAINRRLVMGHVWASNNENGTGSFALAITF